jgi:uncharacterized SAM-binding protein YcdF (DUF218 family)
MGSVPLAGDPDPVIVGGDGWVTLAISCTILVASLGLTLLASLGVILRSAWLAPAAAPSRKRVIVLGHRLETGGRPSVRYCQRLERAAALLEASPVATVHLLGGRAMGCAVSEAEVGADYLIARGVCPRRIRNEDRSRHTLENLQRYRAAFATSDEERAVLVTSRFHLARAGMMARGLGVRHCLCAAEDRPGFCWPMLQEAFLVHWYVTGRTVARWTGNRRMLARIT